VPFPIRFLVRGGKKTCEEDEELSWKKRRKSLEGEKDSKTLVRYQGKRVPQTKETEAERYNLELFRSRRGAVSGKAYRVALFIVCREKNFPEEG